RSKRDWSSDVCSSDLAPSNRGGTPTSYSAPSATQSTPSTAPPAKAQPSQPGATAQSTVVQGRTETPQVYGPQPVVQVGPQPITRSEERRVGKGRRYGR